MTTLNKNFLSPVGFQFVINRKKFSNIEYFCTGVTLPSVSLSQAPVPYKGVNYSEVGDRLEFADLSITFNVTEDMENYVETFEWMQDCISLNVNTSEDAELIILNSHNNVSKRIKFKGIFPTSLDSLDFNAQNPTVEYLQATVTFAYTNFEIL